jgi:hypothetical protein
VKKNETKWIEGINGQKASGGEDCRRGLSRKENNSKRDSGD